MKKDYKRIPELVARVKRQDEDAFVELYNCTYQRVYFIALSIVKDEYLAQDVVQETFINIYKNISGLKKDAAFITWMNRITYHCSLKMIVNKEEVPGCYYMEEEEGRQPEQQEPLECVLLKEESRDIMKFIMELPLEYRVVMILRYYEDLKLKEIADCLECNVGTVKSRLSRGKSSLRKRMSERGVMFVLLITGMALTRSITAYARGHGISETSAAGILESNKRILQIHSKLGLFAPASGALPLLVKTGAVSALVLILTAAGGAVGPAPAVKVTYPADSYTNEAVPVTITVKALFPITSVQLLDSQNRLLEAWKDESGSYKTKLSDNGSYQVRAVFADHSYAEQKFDIEAIDDERPQLDGYTLDEDNNVLHCMVSDSQSGIDYARVYMEAPGAGIQKPLGYDAAAGELEFALPDGTFYIYLYDHSGNFAKYKFEEKMIKIGNLFTNNRILHNIMGKSGI